MFFLRLLYLSFRRQPRSKLLAGVAVSLSVMMATAMITLANNVEDRMNRELRAVGANIVVRPASAALDLSIPGTALRASTGQTYLGESDIRKAKEHFWSHNILGVTPMLNGSVHLRDKDVPLIGTWFAHAVQLDHETFITGTTKTHKWWTVSSAWPQEDSAEALVGQKLVAKLGLHPGDTVSIGNTPLRISGVLSTGGAEDDALVTTLATAQTVLGLPGKVSALYVSALTKPEDEFARRDPKSMPPPVLERWMCSPYANSVAYTIDQAVPDGHAEVVRAVAQNEGAVLSRISGLMLLVTLCALIAGAVAVSAALATSLFERQREVGLLRSLGATRALIGILFFLEASILALLSGLLGFAGGTAIAVAVSDKVFGSSLAWNPVLLPITILVAAAVTLAGSFLAIRRALQVHPSALLRGDPA